MWFTRVSIANPVLATMVMLAFVVLGLFSYQRLKVDQFPDIEFPTVVVTVGYPGASPDIVEADVTRRVEEALNTIAGINEMSSRSYQGSAVVIVQFNLDMDPRQVAEDVREKVANVRPLLPDEVDEPRVLRFDPASRPIFTLSLRSPDGRLGPTELASYADQVLRKRLENVRGVGSVNLVGAVRREIQVRLDPAAMEALGVSVEQVMAAVRTENQEQPAGTLASREGERVVQIDARLQRPQDFGQIIVARRQGVPIQLHQVARIVDGPQDVESLALFNGERTLAIDVLKAQGENTLAVIDGLNTALESLRPELPAGLQVDVIRDSGRPIRVSVDNVRQTLLEGAALTVLIVFLFLNSWRSTVITGLTLPIALIGTFGVMYAFGFSINMVTLMALSLCVGLLIDDAIVVRENIVRHVQMGKPPRQAALDGTQEIGLAVLATTTSIMAVFLPIGFMGGIIGKFFHEFGITIAAAVLISMFVSFTLDPMLSSVWHDPAIDTRSAHRRSLYDRTLGRVTGAFDHATQRLGDGYQTLLRWSLAHKGLTLLAAAGTLAGAFWLVPVLGTEFVPKADYSETNISFHTPVGSSLEVTEAKARQVDAVLRALPEVRYTVTTINTGQAQGKIYANVYVRLVDRHLRTRSQEELTGPLRERLSRVAGITVTHVGLLDPVGGQKSLRFSIQGPDLGELERITGQVRQALAGTPGLVDLDTSLKQPTPTIAVDVRRELASDLGLSIGAIAAPLRIWLAGQVVGSWRAPDDETYDIRVRLAAQDRVDVRDLAALPFVTGQLADGSPRIVRLDQVADLRPSTGPSQINRRNLNREVEVTANSYGRATGEVAADIQRRLDAIELPPGYRFQIGGSTKDMQESFAYALQALGLAVIFIYMILASQFRSFMQPLALMSSLPLTLIGVVGILLLFGSTLNLFSIIGVVMLMGLVTKNAILLIDFAIRARAGAVSTVDLEEAASAAPSTRALAPRPLPRDQALLLAARVRLRPILMTTLAMVFGMMPLAFALSEGSEQRAPMGQAVIGGVITSSLLTLVVVPVVYCYLDDLAAWVRRRFGQGSAARAVA